MLIETIDHCKYCGCLNLTHNGYKTRKIIDGITYGTTSFIQLKIRRYKCKKCNNSFFEPDTLSFDKSSYSLETVMAAFETLKSEKASFSFTARQFSMKRQELMYLFYKHVVFPRPKELPEILCFDEKYVNTLVKTKYVMTIVDFQKYKIVDILPSRLKKDITDYVLQIPLNERKKVKYICMDMWRTYREIAENYFPNAIIAIDSFHVIQLINRALNNLRISIMKKYDNNTESDDPADNSNEYYLLKEHYDLLFINSGKISNIKKYNRKFKAYLSNYELLRMICDIDERLNEARFLREQYIEFNNSHNNEFLENEFNYLIELFKDSKAIQFRNIANTLIEWKEYILNSFIEILNESGTKFRRLSNGPIESINSIISKVYTNGNGYVTFDHFRTRCAYVVNKNLQII